MLKKKTIGILSALAITALVISLGTGLVLAEEADVPEPEAAAVEATADSGEAADVNTDVSERICPVTNEVCTGEARYANQNRPDRAANGEGRQFGDQQRLQKMDGTCETDPEAAQARREAQRAEGGKGRGQQRRALPTD